MTADARWIASSTASAFYAVECRLAGLNESLTQLPDSVADEADDLARALSSLGIEPARFFAHAIPLVTRFDAPRALTEVAIIKLCGGANVDAAAGLSRQLTALLSAYQQAQPEAVDELETRSGPLREQWEARGPGLLATLRRLTEPDVVVESADVLLVQPVLGGGGGAHALYNTLHFEAVLANPVEQLPEILRLGWLWSQLNLDLPKYEDQVGRHRLAQVGPLALMPPLLAAAQEVELARCDRPTLELALEVWRAPAVEADLLFDWWETYQASGSAWPVALGALDRLLSAE